MPIITIALREARLRRKVRGYLRSNGFTKSATGELVPPALDKAAYRLLHLPQRIHRLEKERQFIDRHLKSLIGFFAEGSDLDVESIAPRIELIDAGTWQSDLFRLASSLWSIPVSMGFGRRLRFLVWDSNADKLIGLLALGDPVFNLRARDNFIGWTAADRSRRLVNMLDAYVLGAVPPYSQLLGGKLVACLARSRDVVDLFRERYGGTEGIISGVQKNAHLVGITTTSALGRSSIYNRLQLDGCKYFQPIGYTVGYGHFHFPIDIFDEMRSYLRIRKDPYAGNHHYGSGPNWKFRVIRRSLQRLGLDPGLLKHGLPREVYFSQLADNAIDILRGNRKRPKYQNLRSAYHIGQLAVKRWMLPRSTWDETYKLVTHANLVRRLYAGHEISHQAQAKSDGISNR